MESRPLCRMHFDQIPGHISRAKATGRWRLLFHGQNAVRWLHGLTHLGVTSLVLQMSHVF